MRVHELSKEIDVPNKELVAYLSSKNSAIKNHMSSVSDNEIADAKEHSGKSAAVKAEPAKTEPDKTEPVKDEQKKKD